MKTPFQTGRRFRALLPLIMTGAQLTLLAASLIIHKEPWVAWTMVARALVWLLFATLSLSLLFQRHHNPRATNFMAAIAVLWAGAYLFVGLWSDRRRAAGHRGAT